MSDNDTTRTNAPIPPFSARISLLDVYECGFLDRWVGLTSSSGKSSGSVHLSFRVVAPAGLSLGDGTQGGSRLKYPLLRPTLKSYAIPSPTQLTQLTSSVEPHKKHADGSSETDSSSDVEPAEVISSNRGPRGPSGIGALMPTTSWKSRKGRLSVTVFEIDDVKNKKSKLLASVSLRVGDSNTAGGDAQRTKSKMATEGGLTYEPSQTFGFDLNNVENLVEEDDLELVVEILDKTSLLGASIKKTVVSERRISVRRCLEVPGGELEGEEGMCELGGSW